jgi:hypothetical protein
MRFYIIGPDIENAGYSSEEGLIAHLERNVTLKNYQTIRIQTYSNTDIYIDTYSYPFDVRGDYLFTKDHGKKILTPTIKQKLDAESKNNSPQNVQRIESYKYLLYKGGEIPDRFVTTDQLIKELEKVVTGENIKTIAVIVHKEIEAVTFLSRYCFYYDGSYLHSESDPLENKILTPTIKQKLDAESKNNSPQNVQRIESYKYLSIKDDKVLGDFDTFDQLIKELEKVITSDNIKTIKVLYERYGTNSVSEHYYFNHNGFHLYSVSPGKALPTPTIKQKLDAESKNNSPQNVQPNKTYRYLSIPDGKILGHCDTFDKLIKELEKVVTSENIMSIKVIEDESYGAIVSSRSYWFWRDGSSLHREDNCFIPGVPTPTIKQKLDTESKNNPPQNVEPIIKQKLDAESKNNFPQNVQPDKPHMYALCKGMDVQCTFDTIDKLIKELEKVVTCENIRTIDVLVQEDIGVGPECYCFNCTGVCLSSILNPTKVILTPTIKQKLDAESKNNSPQNIKPIETYKYFLYKGGESLGRIVTTDQLIKELEKVVTSENIKTIAVTVYEENGSAIFPTGYCFNHDGSYLHPKSNSLGNKILTPTIKQKLDAESKNNSPQNVQPNKTYRYFSIGNDKPLGNCDTFDQLIKELEIVVTSKNIKTIKVVEDEDYGNIVTISNYWFYHDGSYLHLGWCPLVATFPTPSIKQKLDAEKNNPPQNIQTTKINENYLLIKDNDVQEKSFDDLQKELSKMLLSEIQKITLYNLADKIIYKFSTQKILFESNNSKTLSDELTKHLTCIYKMLIVSAEDPNNPFKLTKKYICEKKVLIQDNESLELSQYRRNQLVSHGSEFKFDGLFKGHLVRIFLIKNNIIIGEINNAGLFHKNKHKGVIASGAFINCQKAIVSYIDYVNEFRKKSFEEIKKIYSQMEIDKIVCLPALNILNNVDKIVDIMIKANELNIFFSEN